MRKTGSGGRLSRQVLKAGTKADGSGESHLTQTKSRLRRLNVKAVKGLGQHFLTDRSVLETIVAAAELSTSDIVIEVGAGLGVLTEELVRRAGTIIAVEIDPKLASALKDNYPATDNLSIVNADVLDLDPVDLLGGHISGLEYSHTYKVIANLPYYVAAPIMRHFLEASLKPALMVVMVQKEVGQHIVAGPGAMNLMGVSVQLYGKPTIVDYVPARSFYPQPKVDSAIVRIEVYPEPAVDIEDIPGFFSVVKAGFSTKRKQLRNSLNIGLGIGVDEVVAILEQAGVEPQRRPQTLSLDEWADVYRSFACRGDR